MTAVPDSARYYTPEEVAAIMRMELPKVKRLMSRRVIGGTLRICDELRARRDLFGMWLAEQETRTAGN